MDLTWSDADEAFRAEARAWLEVNVPEPSLPSGDTAEGFALHLDWERRLHEDRWSVVSWPQRYGGRDASLWQWLIFEQQDRLLPRMAAAEDLWCQGWSEPGAGSDLAGISSRAAKVEGGWVLNGQKTWTTRGAFCTHLFGLFRSDPESDRHRGLTYLLVPLDAPGVTVRGFGRLDGDEGFAEVFLDDVFVGDDAVLGGVGEGWRVAMATTGSERGLTLRSPGRFLAATERLMELYRQRQDTASPVTRDRVVRSWMDAEAYRLFTLGTVTGIAEGHPIGAESSLNKIWWSEMDVRLHETALELLDGEAELDGPWMRGFEFSLSGPIYAGTNEVQRNIAAERVLGLPRR
jgi:alkylation response protein AidB-like acyl-CoA dehydrogenase